MVSGKGFTVQGFGFNAEGLGLRVLFLRVLGLGFRASVQTIGGGDFGVLRVQALGLRSRDYNTYPKP